MQFADGGWGWFSGIGRTLLAAHDGLRRPRLADRQEQRRRAAAGHAGTRRQQWLKNYQNTASCSMLQERAGEDQARTKNRPTISTRSSTWCSSTRQCRQRRDARLPLSRPQQPGGLHQGDVRPGAQQAEAGREARDDHAEHRTVPRPGRRKPDRVSQAARKQLLVVLVRQRKRSAGLLLEAARRDRSEGREGRGWSSICSTTASTPPTGTARATRRSASKRWPITSPPAAKTRPT